MSRQTSRMTEAGPDGSVIRKTIIKNLLRFFWPKFLVFEIVFLIILSEEYSIVSGSFEVASGCVNIFFSSVKIWCVMCDWNVFTDNQSEFHIDPSGCCSRFFCFLSLDFSSFKSLKSSLGQKK